MLPIHSWLWCYVLKYRGQPSRGRTVKIIDSLSMRSQLGAGTHEPLQPPCSIVGCLDLVQVFCQQPQLLWVLGRSSPARHVQKTLFHSGPPRHGFTVFLPFFLHGPWTLGWKGCDAGVTLVTEHSLGTYSLYFGQLWFSELTVIPCVIRAEISTALWV